jgi:tetratricopeptide (TPR) repeat protein
VEAELAKQPDSLSLRFERACILSELGRDEEARRAYLELLVRQPTHRESLNNLGTLLYATGYRKAASTAYREAVFHHPKDPTSRVNLANLLLQEGELDEAREHFQAALRQAPDHPQAHQGLGSLLVELGDPVAAFEHQRIGYSGRPIVVLPYRGDSLPFRVLMLVSPNGANVPIRHLLDDRTFQTTVLLPQFFDSGNQLPEHDLVFNAIGDADHSEEALKSAIQLMSLSNKPVVNDPVIVLRTGRKENLDRFQSIPGVVTALSALFPRELLMNLKPSDLQASDLQASDLQASDLKPGDLQAGENLQASDTLASLGFSFPLLLRTPGFHNGRHFLKVASPEALPAAAASLPGKDLIALQFLDARGPDGKVRKYRIMFVNGQMYPLHLAISGDWKIHYVTAEMSGNASHRAEEAGFLRDMASALGDRALSALKRIQRELALDYAGIDFSLSPEGEVLLFEANATMVVMMPEPDERWDYRRAAVERIHEAVRDMLTTPPRRNAKLPM